VTDIAWVFRRHWHPKRRRFAHLRALWWIIVRRHETEICGLCGGPVGLVWHAPDALWWERSGFPTDAGVLCIRCFDEQAGGLWWECADGVSPSCAGSPCPHQESMMIIAKQRDAYWEQLQQAAADRSSEALSPHGEKVA